MSLPSIVAIADNLGINLLTATPEEQETVLVNAMRQDLPLAWDYMHKKSHEAQKAGGEAIWSEPPKSLLGQQLIRIHTDALRPLMEKHCMHGLQSTFVNCCGGKVKDGGRLNLIETIALQIQMQDGRIANPDC